MSILHIHNGYPYEWDLEKARQNLHKHSVSFEMACEVFDDRDILSVRNYTENYEEERWQHPGRVRGCTLLLVVSTDRDNRIRIISARKAVSKEIKRYEQW